MARLLIGLLAACTLSVTLSSARADLVINEVKIQGDEWVEIYNPGPDTVDAHGWGFCNSEIAGACLDLFGVLLPGQFRTYTYTYGVYYPDYGGTLFLKHYATRTRGDAVSYGIFGGAPIGRGTIFRYPDGHDTDDDARDFEFLPMSHFGLGTRGTTNTPTSPQIGSDLILNEVKWHSHLNNEISAIELFNPTGQDVDLFGYWIADGDGMCEVTKHVIVPAGGLQVIRQGEPGEGLHCTGSNGITFDRIDVIYLYRPPRVGEQYPVRVDQLGIFFPLTGVQDPTRSYQRCPDGSGPNDGFDYPSSGGDVSLFFDTPSLGASNNMLCAVQIETSSWGRIKSIYR